MSHSDNSKKNSKEHIGDSFKNYDFNDFRPPPIPGGLFPPSQPAPPPYQPQPGAFPSPNGPQGSPPKYTPNKKDSGVQSLNSQGGALKSVSSTSIKICLYKYTYIWETSGRSYWAFLINVDKTSVSGFRWFGYSWVMFGLDLKRIDSFVCYRSDLNYVYDNVDNNRSIIDTLVNSKVEYSTKGIRETYNRALTSLDIQDVKEDLTTHTIGIVEDKNIDCLIPCIKTRTVSYRISVEVSYPENMENDIKSSIITLTNNAANETIKYLNDKNHNRDNLTPLEQFDSSLNSIPKMLQVFSESFSSTLYRAINNKDLLKEVTFKILYEKVAGNWYIND